MQTASLKADCELKLKISDIECELVREGSVVFTRSQFNASFLQTLKKLEDPWFLKFQGVEKGNNSLKSVNCCFTGWFKNHSGYWSKIETTDIGGNRRRAGRREGGQRSEGIFFVTVIERLLNRFNPNFPIPNLS